MSSFSPHVDTTGFLRMAASAEMRSEHPLGKAVVDYARKKEIVFQSDRFTMVPGKGIRARIDERISYAVMSRTLPISIS